MAVACRPWFLPSAPLACARPLPVASFSRAGNVAMYGLSRGGICGPFRCTFCAPPRVPFNPIWASLGGASRVKRSRPRSISFYGRDRRYPMALSGHTPDSFDTTLSGPAGEGQQVGLPRPTWHPTGWARRRESKNPAASRRCISRNVATVCLTALRSSAMPNSW